MGLFEKIKEFVGIKSKETFDVTRMSPSIDEVFKSILMQVTAAMFDKKKKYILDQKVEIFKWNRAGYVALKLTNELPEAILQRIQEVRIDEKEHQIKLAVKKFNGEMLYCIMTSYFREPRARKFFCVEEEKAGQLVKIFHGSRISNRQHVTVVGINGDGAIIIPKKGHKWHEGFLENIVIVFCFEENRRLQRVEYHLKARVAGRKNRSDPTLVISFEVSAKDQYIRDAVMANIQKIEMMLNAEKKGYGRQEVIVDTGESRVSPIQKGEARVKLEGKSKHDPNFARKSVEELRKGPKNYPYGSSQR
ncbi:MAG: hypothetical protein HQK60_18370 [Deltaproteobacteria bacterium]|nr:hypothetical protein [Deltaproteobacteria bacterium]